MRAQALESTRRPWTAIATRSSRFCAVVATAAIVGCSSHDDAGPGDAGSGDAGEVPSNDAGSINQNHDAGAGSKPIWAAAWADAPDSASGGGGSNQTFREIVKPTVGSRGRIRLHFRTSSAPRR